MSPSEIRSLEPDDAPACDAIVAGLPYHFGQEQGRRDCAAAVRRDPGPEPDDGYLSTRAFYRSVGFVLARDLPREWDGGDTAVLLVRSLAAR